MNVHEFEHTPEENEGQVKLVCRSPWSCKGLSLPLSQGLISVSEVEAKSPGAQCRIQIGIICASVHIPGARPQMRTQGACLMGEKQLTKGVCVHIPYTT